MTTPELLTVPEVAKELRISDTQVYRLASTGALPHIRVGSRYLFTREQIDAYLVANSVDPRELELRAAELRVIRSRLGIVDEPAAS